MDNIIFIYHKLLPGVSVEPGGCEHQISGGVSLAQSGHEQSQQSPANTGRASHVLTYLKCYYAQRSSNVEHLAGGVFGNKQINFSFT